MAEEDGGRTGFGARGVGGDQPKEMVSAHARRQQRKYARERVLSARRACALYSVARPTLGYVSRLAATETPGAEAMQQMGGDRMPIVALASFRPHYLMATSAYR